MPANNAVAALSGIGLFKADVNVAVAEYKLAVAKVRQANRNPLENEARRKGYRSALDRLNTAIRVASERHFGHLGDESEGEEITTKAAE